MNKLQKILNQLGPLSSEELVGRFIKMLSDNGIHTLSDREIDRVLMFATNDSKAILREGLALYLQQGKFSRYHKSKLKRTVKDNLLSTSRGYYSDNLSTSLKAQGFEYGLSDW